MLRPLYRDHFQSANRLSRLISVLLELMLLTGFSLPAELYAADEFERAPIEYSRTTPTDRVTRLQQRLERGDARLEFDERLGYLPALLTALDILPESQTLVFSKTSMQRGRITPRTPRAIYFNDEVYVGFCHAGNVLELSTADPQLGAVFYTLDQQRVDAPRLLRETDSCLLCHGSSQTDHVPGHRVRSVFVDPSGLPILSGGSQRVDHTTPLEDRWGGWYVTGRHGSQSHLGNLIIRSAQVSFPVDNQAGLNVTDLHGRCAIENYLTSSSDIVALMALEHQTHVHNLLTKANYAARQAAHYELEFNRAINVAKAQPLESTTRRIQSAGDKLLEGLLFTNEAPLRSPIAGSTDYAQRFAQLGRRDRQGRSLRDFDLTKRMFRYPCSYLIDTPAFEQLPSAMKRYVVQRLREILTAPEPGPAFAHLSRGDRQAILEILTDTHPKFWDVALAAPAIPQPRLAD